MPIIAKHSFRAIYAMEVENDQESRASKTVAARTYLRDIFARKVSLCWVKLINITGRKHDRQRTERSVSRGHSVSLWFEVVWREAGIGEHVPARGVGREPAPEAALRARR